MDPSGTGGRIYNENDITLLHTHIKAIGLVVLEIKDVCLFSHCKYMYMGANIPRCVGILNRRSVIGINYVKRHINKQALGFVVSEKNILICLQL